MTAPGFDADLERMPLDRLLSRAGRSLDRFHRRTVVEHGLTATGLDVLGALAGGDVVSHRELAAQLGVTPATLTPVVDALAEAGDVARVRGPADRRVVRLSLTPAGRRRLATASRAVAVVLRDRLPRPAAEREATVRGYLLAVLAAVDEDRAAP